MMKSFVMGGFAIAIGACSNATDFAPAMSSFSAATDKAKAALESYDKAGAARITELRREEAVAKPVGVQMVDGDCYTDSSRCRVVYMVRQGDPDPKPLTVNTLAPEHLAVMREIALYAKALKDLSQADATPEVKAAVDQATAATTGLASIVYPAASPAISAAAAPTGQFAVWAFGKYQEHVKLNALRFATRQMEPTMRDAVAKFGQLASLFGRGDRLRLEEDLQRKGTAFGQSRTRAALDAYLTSARQLDDALSPNPRAVFDDMGKAHSALTAALNEQDPVSLADAFRAINRLSADAEALYAMAESFRKAAEKVKP